MDSQICACVTKNFLLTIDIYAKKFMSFHSFNSIDFQISWWLNCTWQVLCHVFRFHLILHPFLFDFVSSTSAVILRVHRSLLKRLSLHLILVKHLLFLDCPYHSAFHRSTGLLWNGMTLSIEFCLTLLYIANARVVSFPECSLCSFAHSCNHSLSVAIYLKCHVAIGASPAAEFVGCLVQ